MIFYIWHWFFGKLPEETFKHPFAFINDDNEQVIEELTAVKIDTLEELIEFTKRNHGVIQVKSSTKDFPYPQIIVTDAKGTRFGQR